MLDMGLKILEFLLLILGLPCILFSDSHGQWLIAFTEWLPYRG